MKVIECDLCGKIERTTFIEYDYTIIDVTSFKTWNRGGFVLCKECHDREIKRLTKHLQELRDKEQREVEEE